MPVVQDSFFIPDDLAVGLATGLYKRFGSVIRYASGPTNCKAFETCQLKYCQRNARNQSAPLF